MAVTVSGSVAFARKRSKPLRGKDIKGHQAADLLAAMTDEEEADRQDPRVKKPRVLIETMRVIGEDIMTAHDAALYEFLLARARNEGIDLDSHEVEVSEMMRYLNVPRTDRIVESLERITRTVVRYDLQDEEVRRRGAMPLILAELSENLRAGTAVLNYAIPGPIRRAVMAARDYALLEINAFARFRNRYTGRLYQRLAYRAGMDETMRKPWEVTPLQLAQELGYPLNKDGTLHYGSFIRRCLEPAMDEIAEHTTRFDARWEAVKGKGRGSPVEKIVLRVSGMRKRFEEHKAIPLTHRGLAAVRAVSWEHAAHELPGTLAVGKAMTATGMDELEVTNGWREALSRAKADPNAEVAPGLQGGLLLRILRQDGVQAALDRWSMAASWREPTAPPAPARTKDSRIGIPEGAIILEEREGYRQCVIPGKPKAAPYPTVEEQEAMYRQALAERAAREANEEAAPHLATPPAPPAFTFKRPAPRVARPAPEPDPFDGGGRVLETADDIPF